MKVPNGLDVKISPAANGKDICPNPDHVFGIFWLLKFGSVKVHQRC
jgi:hypothetical protein